MPTKNSQSAGAFYWTPSWHEKNMKTKSHMISWPIKSSKKINPILETPLFFCRDLGLSSPLNEFPLCSLPSPPPVDFHLGWWTSARLEVANPQRQPRSFLWPLGWTELNKDACGSKRNLHVFKLSDDVGGGRLNIPEDRPLVRMERILVIQLNLGATGNTGTCKKQQKVMISCLSGDHSLSTYGLCVESPHFYIPPKQTKSLSLLIQCLKIPRGQIWSPYVAPPRGHRRNLWCLGFPTAAWSLTCEVPEFSGGNFGVRSSQISPEKEKKPGKIWLKINIPSSWWLSHPPNFPKHWSNWKWFPKDRGEN